MQPMTHRYTVDLRRLERDSHDTCSLCGHAFHVGDVAHSGYGADGEPLYVGDCCKVNVAETAARYHWEVRAYDTPDADALLWRYMDFARFVALLKESALYFSRADLLGDRFEGAKGLVANKSKWDKYYLKWFRDALLNPPPGTDFGLSAEELERRAQQFIVDLEALGRDGLRTTFVSCWHESQVESEALWRLYCPPSSAGVAIRTTFSALTLSLGDDHLTASLYFGIAALEAFLNAKMRAHLRATNTENQIVDVLRKGRILQKLNKWPIELLGKPLNLTNEMIDLLTDFNDIRGNLTHPKTTGHDIYERLETIEPDAVVGAVADYMVKYHEADGTRYPYWIFGWNYLNPRRNSYEIFLINDQQFCFSLQAIGLQVPTAAYWEAEAWRNLHLGAFEGYVAIRDALSKLDHCEPKVDRFPFKPILCRRWWASDHHRSCGHVSA